MKLNVNRTYFKNSRPQQPSSRPLTLTALIVELAWRCRRRWKESPGFGGVMIAADVSTLYIIRYLKEKYEIGNNYAKNIQNCFSSEYIFAN